MGAGAPDLSEFCSRLAIPTISVDPTKYVAPNGASRVSKFRALKPSARPFHDSDSMQCPAPGGWPREWRLGRLLGEAAFGRQQGQRAGLERARVWALRE